VDELHEEQYADDPTALGPESVVSDQPSVVSDGSPPAAPAQDDWPLGVEAPGDSLPTASEWIESLNSIPTRIRDLRERVRLTSAQLAAAKEEAKECKKANQDAIAALMKALDESGANSPHEQRATNNEQPSPAADPEAWRPFELARLDLPPSVVQALADADLTTMGQLCDYTNNGGLLTDIKKIGAGKAEKIDLACEKFWAEHPEFGEAAGEPAESGNFLNGINPECFEEQPPDDEPEAEEEPADEEGPSDEAYEGL
jgi:Phage integrase protein.